MANAETRAVTLSPPTKRHAVWIFTLPMGASDGSEQQIQALLAPRYQLAQRGITFVNSPRHANIILLTGALTQRMLDPVRRLLAQVPDPHAVIAVGDAALRGGLFVNSPDLIPHAADELGVNVEIAGTPPSPTQILQAIEEAAHLLEQAEIGGDDDDAPEENAENDEPEATA